MLQSSRPPQLASLASRTPSPQTRRTPSPSFARFLAPGKTTCMVSPTEDIIRFGPSKLVGCWVVTTSADGRFAAYVGEVLSWEIADGECVYAVKDVLSGWVGERVRASEMAYLTDDRKAGTGAS